MKVFKLENKGKVVLLDNKMRVVKPVYNYLEFLRLKDSSFNTLISYARDLKLFWEFLNDKGYSYDTIKPIAIGEFIEHLREPYEDENIHSLNIEPRRTGKTINRILSTVYNFYKYVGMIEKIDNPIIMDEVDRPFSTFKGILHHARKNNKTAKSLFKVKEDEKKIKLVSDEDARVFLNELPTWRDKLIFKLMYSSGMRIGEVLSLQIEYIPLPDKMDSKVGVLESVPTKGEGTRDVFVPAEILEELDEYIMEERNDIDTEHSYLFVSLHNRYFGKPLTYHAIYNVFSKVKEKTGISFNFHDLRHTYITNLAESGMDASVVKIIAGHKHVSTTQKYTHLPEKHISNCLKKFWDNNGLLLDGGLNV